MIKGMVCERCVTILRDGLTRLGYPPSQISLGKITWSTTPVAESKPAIERYIRESGFELVSSRQVRIVNRIKELIDDVFGPSSKQEARIKFSAWLSESLHMNYDSLSQVFAELEGITLEKYIIARRLDKVREMLVYTNLSLTESRAALKKRPQP